MYYMASSGLGLTPEEQQALITANMMAAGGAAGPAAAQAAGVSTAASFPPPVSEADKIARAIAAAGQAAPAITQAYLSFRKPIQIQCPGTGQMVWVSQGSTPEQIKAACGGGAGGVGAGNEVAWGSLLTIGGIALGVGLIAYLVFRKK